MLYIQKNSIKGIPLEKKIVNLRQYKSKSSAYGKSI